MNSIKYFIYFIIIFSTAKYCFCILLFPQNSAFGIIAAIAVPLDLPHQNVFLSYNFEANYNYPFQFDIPPILNGIEDEDVESRHLVSGGEKCNNCTNLNNNDILIGETTMAGVENFTETVTLPSSSESTESSKKKKKKRSTEKQPLLSRLNFYHILQHRFVRSGYAGEACLLRLICETNSSELGDINGVLGTLIHILFSPSTSRQENIPIIYYQAEYDGVRDECHNYYGGCKESLLELISTSYSNIIEEMISKR